MYVLGKKCKAEGGISAKALRQESAWGITGMIRPGGEKSRGAYVWFAQDCAGLC